MPAKMANSTWLAKRQQNLAICETAKNQKTTFYHIIGIVPNAMIGTPKYLKKDYKL